MSRKRPRSESPEKLTQSEIYPSGSILDRASTFIAAYSPTASARELQKLSEFKDATHRIAAWRTRSKQASLSQKPIYNVGHDDDGEQYAGKKLEKVLTDREIEGSVVVARWYGGVLLGPVRFAHIEHCARQAIEGWKKTADETAKKRKLQQDEQEQRPALIVTLEQRDQSIAVLRKMLAERQEGKDLKDAPIPSPTKPVYHTMPLGVLRRLEKARDGTIAWILMELDKIEQPQAGEPSAAAETCTDGTMPKRNG